MVSFLTDTVVCGFSLYHILAYFLIYSCIGWCLEVIYAAATTGQLVNRGFLNGPVCPIYGFGMIIVLFALTPLQHSILLLYIGGVILPSALELVGGWALYKLYHTRWWDYSDFPFNIGGYICLEFCLLWGVFYGTDSFQDRNGLTARGGTVEELAALTERFAEKVSALSNQIQRDEKGCFAVPRSAIFADAMTAYDGVVEEFDCLKKPNAAPKAFVSSRGMSYLDFSGFYFPFTGEANLNDESPACYLPANICHELAHLRGVASEQECNFIAIAASTTADSAAYRYSGWLMGFTYLSNALYRADPEAWQAVRVLLPDTVVADLRDNSAYWAAFEGPVNDAAQKVYDSFLKSSGDPRGTQSYGTVVDMLMAYYG